MLLDPDIDRSERLLDGGRRPFDLIGVRDIGRQHQRRPAQRFDLLPRSLQSGLAACKQSDPCALPGKRLRGCPSNAGRGPGDDDDLGCPWHVLFTCAQQMLLPTWVVAPIVVV